MKPSIGRIVHYISPNPPVGRCVAAVITVVLDEPGSGPVGLCVMEPTGVFIHGRAEYDEGQTPGSWHWPEWVA